MTNSPEPTVQIGLTRRPAAVIEYGIAERKGDRLVDLPQCGSWYSDRHYADDLTGYAAAEAAARRVAAQVDGEYVIVELRRFRRVFA